ncbi:hypothetical protein J4457_04025 [Candidatus Woesearchaeota archaeon]|nr:hypothetical protein [Candidatus Woesearchaeota archaeon]
MELIYLIYPGTEPANAENIQRTKKSLIPAGTEERQVTVHQEGSVKQTLESILEKNDSDFVVVFQEAGVTNTPNYVAEINKRVGEGIELGAARWQYTDKEGGVSLMARLTQWGCNIASKYQKVIHNNGFVTANLLRRYLENAEEPKIFSDIAIQAFRERKPFVYISSAAYSIPVPGEIQNSFLKWMKEDVPNAIKTGYNYLKGLVNR